MIFDSGPLLMVSDAVAALDYDVAADVWSATSFQQLRNEALDRATGAELFFKCENLQETGAFKLRGASNAVQSLPDEGAARGVATHSSGNHGTCLAYAAERRGIQCTVVMPRTAPKVGAPAMADTVPSSCAAASAAPSTMVPL